MAVFGPKPWVNRFEKMSIFRLFELLVFTALKGLFSFQKIIKDIFLAYIARKKKLQKRHFLDQNYELTALEKSQFFDFLNLFLLQPRTAFFRFKISLETFSLRIVPKKKKLGKWPFSGPKPWVNPFAKMSIFCLFELLVFMAQKSVFSFQNIIKDCFLAYIG